MVCEAADLSIVNQCELLDLARSSYYYESVPESELNLQIMKMIDKLYITFPFYGSRRMTIGIRKLGHLVNRKRVQRLMRTMCIETQYPKPRTSIGNKEHYKYPYLLDGLEIVRPNQVWGTDITYIPLREGFLYLTAIIDLYSRYVLAWNLSDNMEVELCLKPLEKALKKGIRTEIMNSDQGSQYTSKAWTDMLKEACIAISMTGTGRCWDNIFVERLWRSLKYEEVYIKEYCNVKEVQEGIGCYFDFFNNQRPHASLSYKTPREVYFGK